MLEAGVFRRIQQYMSIEHDVKLNKGKKLNNLIWFVDLFRFCKFFCFVFLFCFVLFRLLCVNLLCLLGCGWVTRWRDFETRGLSQVAEPQRVCVGSQEPRRRRSSAPQRLAGPRVRRSWFLAVSTCFVARHLQATLLSTQTCAAGACVSGRFQEININRACLRDVNYECLKNDVYAWEKKCVCVCVYVCRPWLWTKKKILH